MDTKFPHVSGMRDILSRDHEYFTFIKKVVRYNARRCGMRRISLPALLDFELLKTSLGEASDIVSRHLFKIVNEEGVFALRPEYASSMARAYIEHNLHELPQPVEFYYIDQSWHKTAPEDTTQELAEVHSFGFEILGEEDPALDAQLIEMCMKIYRDLGLEVELRINNIGTKASQDKYMEDLRNFFAGKERNLSNDDVFKLAINPLHVLSSLHEDTQILAQIAPSIASSLDKESKEHFKKVTEHLEGLDIAYTFNDKLFGGLDYYRHVYFEFVLKREDGKEVILGRGGRYNDLVAQLGGPKTPALTFSADMDAISRAMQDVHLSVPSKDKVSVFVVQLGDTAKQKALKLVSDLRSRGIRTMGALGKASIRSQLESASKFDVDYALVLGQMEVVEKKIIMRDMKKGTQETFPFEGIIDHMVELLDPSQLDTKDFRAMIEEASDSDEE